MRNKTEVYLLSPYPTHFCYMRYSGKHQWRVWRLEEMKRAQEMKFTHVSTGSGRVRITTAIKNQQIIANEF